jgi:hypothetical protein
MGVETQELSITIDTKARIRYESLFDRNLEAQNRRKASSTQQKGWRGSPAAFLKGPPQAASPSMRLEGHIVKAIWDCSQLNKYQLKRIWCVSISLTVVILLLTMSQGTK